jgi:anti-sigma factor RsiW
MKCEDCQPMLIDYAYAELAPDARAEATRHLTRCPACALAFCRLRADLDGVLLVAGEAPPAALRQRLRAEVERSFRPPWWRRAWAVVLRPVPAYALVVAALVPALGWLASDVSGVRAPDLDEPRPLRMSGYDAAAPLLPPRPIL